MRKQNITAYDFACPIAYSFSARNIRGKKKSNMGSVQSQWPSIQSAFRCGSKVKHLLLHTGPEISFSSASRRLNSIRLTHVKQKSNLLVAWGRGVEVRARCGVWIMTGAQAFSPRKPTKEISSQYRLEGSRPR